MRMLLNLRYMKGPAAVWERGPTLAPRLRFDVAMRIDRFRVELRAPIGMIPVRAAVHAHGMAGTKHSEAVRKGASGSKLGTVGCFRGRGLRPGFTCHTWMTKLLERPTMSFRDATTAAGAQLKGAQLMAMDLLLRTDRLPRGAQPYLRSTSAEDPLQMLGLAARLAQFEGGPRRLGRSQCFRYAAPTRMYSSSCDTLGWNDRSRTTPRESRNGPERTAVHLAPPPRSASRQFVNALLRAPEGLATSPATNISSRHALIGDPATPALTLLRGPRNMPWLHSMLATIAR